jgi:hypothetical protein
MYAHIHVEMSIIGVPCLYALTKLLEVAGSLLVIE